MDVEFEYILDNNVPDAFPLLHNLKLGSCLQNLDSNVGVQILPLDKVEDFNSIEGSLLPTT